MPETTPTVAEWSHGDIAEDRILGWIALYWDGSGSINQADVYSSIPLPWNFVTHQPDPELLPTEHLQGYMLFWRRYAHMYCTWFDSYDEYWLWGKSEMVTGTLIPDNKWSAVQNRLKGDIWGHRGQFKGSHTFWLNEVPD